MQASGLALLLAGVLPCPFLPGLPLFPVPLHSYTESGDDFSSTSTSTRTPWVLGSVQRPPPTRSRSARMLSARILRPLLFRDTLQPTPTSLPLIKFYFPASHRAPHISLFRTSVPITPRTARYPSLLRLNLDPHAIAIFLLDYLWFLPSRAVQ
ncbi:hypothetical protein BV25DRAFT_1136616 [Artomyces pyxidatus]|uniref:Uncharacterized protein n=1 Tax=Artomyces pyxidatus TaxID=48021 RepID=A0ACB8STZ2_9AGAM|nr:hypothetical protein BV25DRAFT_1136616 [Artomyces pyxidatus]